MYKNVTDFPVEDLDLLQKGGLLWYKFRDEGRYWLEDEAIQECLGPRGWDRVGDTLCCREVRQDRGLDMQWFIRVECDD